MQVKKIFHTHTVIALWLLLFLYFLFIDPVWQLEKHDSIMGWDVFGYYLYLPSFFIYGSLHELDFINEIIEKYDLSSYFYQAHLVPNGNYVMNYPLGMALVYLPFFFIGHLIALITDFPADGFSIPYKLSLFIGGALYTIAGLLIAGKILQRYFSDLISFLLLFLLIFGTNYFHYTLLENLMTHNYLFTIYAALLYLTIKWHDEPKKYIAISIGALLGLAVIIRPSEVVALLIPLLYGITGKKSLLAKIRLVKQKYIHLTLLIVATLLVGSLQLIYWKITTGDILYYTYQGIGFDFLHPHIFKGLFSIRKGWLLFTPLMIFALLGFIWLYKRAPKLFFPLLIFTIINIYFIFSWSVWWYGGSFGARPMVQSYVLLLLPLGSAMVFAYRRIILWYIFLLLSAFFIWLNIFQDWQLSQKMYSTEGMNKYIYQLIFAKTNISKQDIIRRTHKEILPKDVDLESDQLYYQDFSNMFRTDTSIYFSPSSSHKLESKDELSVSLQPQLGKEDWLEVSMMGYFIEFEWEVNNMAEAEITFEDSNGEVIKRAYISLQNIIGNDEIDASQALFGKPNVWDRISFATKVPEEGYNKVILNVRNKGHHPVYIDDLTINAYRR